MSRPPPLPAGELRRLEAPPPSVRCGRGLRDQRWVLGGFVGVFSFPEYLTETEAPGEDSRDLQHGERDVQKFKY